MIKELQHGPLNFPVSRFIVIESFGSDGIDLVNENDGG